MFFLNPIRLSETEKKDILQCSSMPDKILFFSYGVGIVGENVSAADPSFMEQLFGCSFKTVSGEKIARSCTTTDQAEKLFGIPSGLSLKTYVPIGPVCFPVAAPQVIPLALTPEGDIAIAAVRRGQSWLIFSALAVSAPEIYHGFAATAGLPRIRTDHYSPVWFGYSTVAVHTEESTSAVLTLPKGFSGVKEFPDGHFIPAENGRIVKKIPAVSTWLVQLVK